MVKARLLDVLDDDTSGSVPREEPFTTAFVLANGISRRQLDHWVDCGELARPLRGVFHDRRLVDDLSLRLACLRLVVPEDCVVTDRTAAWLWGAPMVLSPGDHERTPIVSVFSPPGLRLRNGLTSSGERKLRPSDVDELKGLRITTPLRTACDLGRLLHRDQALAAMDSLSSLGVFATEELVGEAERFRGYRGVVQLRVLGPLVDPLAGSPGESALRLRWYDAGLPRPRCQVPVETPWGSSYFIDVGLEEHRLGAEYDGVEFHGPEQEAHDAGRRLWLREGAAWEIVVTRRENVYGHHQDAEGLLRAAAQRILWTNPR